MREKLIEVLETVVSPNELLCYGEVLVSTSRVADHLIANDVVPVVRCKDCKYWKPGDSFGGDSLDDMQRIGGCPNVRFCRRENDFCSYGKRKEHE